MSDNKASSRTPSKSSKMASMDRALTKPPSLISSPNCRAPCLRTKDTFFDSTVFASSSGFTRIFPSISDSHSLSSSCPSSSSIGAANPSRAQNPAPVVVLQAHAAHM